MRSRTCSTACALDTPRSSASISIIASRSVIAAPVHQLNGVVAAAAGHDDQHDRLPGIPDHAAGTPTADATSSSVASTANTGVHAFRAAGVMRGPCSRRCLPTRSQQSSHLSSATASSSLNRILLLLDESRDLAAELGHLALVTDRDDDEQAAQRVDGGGARGR